MMRIPLRLILAVGVAALGLTLLGWGFAAPQRTIRRQVIVPGLMRLASDKTVNVPETLLLTLEYPAVIRMDEADKLRMTVEVQPASENTGIANVYETHQVMAETRLDLAGMNLRPSGTVSEALLPGQTVTFFWSVRPSEVGKFAGTLWLYLRFYPKDGGPALHKAISSQSIEIESAAFWGLGAEAARTVGTLAVVGGVVLGFSFFVGGVKWVVGRRSQG